MTTVLPTHAGLTADMFVVRGDRFLTLERGPGRGEGLWYLPGGGVDRGEDPLDAAVRETQEEAGLLVRDARILRAWTYPTPEGHETTHVTFLSRSDEGEVVLSHEHTAFRWTTVADYVDRWCDPEFEVALPEHAVWIRQVRRNCELVAAILGVESTIGSVADRN